MEIRFVETTDSLEILDIYTFYIQNTAYTFEYIVPTHEEFIKRVEDISKELPYIVAVEDGVIVGYAYASKYRGRAAYQWDVELSIYLRQDIQHHGVGSQLYSVLLDMLKRQGYQRAYACITIPNPVSVAFHKKFDFKEIGIFHQCGYKHQTWFDVLWMELFLQCDEHPAMIKHINDVKIIK